MDDQDGLASFSRFLVPGINDVFANGASDPLQSAHPKDDICLDQAA